MKLHMTFLLTLVLLTVSLCAVVPVDSGSANAQFNAGRTAEALSSYRTLLASSAFAKAGSFELWYNRGLAEEKIGETVAASLSFRRALILSPGFVPARRQLSKILESLGVPFRETPIDKAFTLISPEVMILGGAILGWLGLLAFVVLLYANREKKGYLALALVCFVLGHGVSLAGSMTDPRRVAASQGVVTSKTAPTLRATPADSGTAAGTLSPGTLTSILSRNGAWWYVSDGSGHTGWIPSDTITPLIPALHSASGS